MWCSVCVVCNVQCVMCSVVCSLVCVVCGISINKEGNKEQDKRHYLQKRAFEKEKTLYVELKRR